jgi:5-methylcytosine-specific restriction endonuclease McrA
MIPKQLKDLVRKRAHYRCEYCLLPEGFSIVSFHIDHITPEKHRGLTEDHNLCLACNECNLRKGTDYGSFDPATGEHQFFFNPR